MKTLKDDKEYSLKDIEKLLNPGISTLIIGTIVFLTPYVNLILKIVSKDYIGLLLSALLIFPTLILLFVLWSWYIYRLKVYKQEAKDIMNELKKDRNN